MCVFWRELCELKKKKKSLSGVLVPAKIHLSHLQVRKVQPPPPQRGSAPQLMSISEPGLKRRFLLSAHSVWVFCRQLAISILDQTLNFKFFENVTYFIYLARDKTHVARDFPGCSHDSSANLAPSLSEHISRQMFK